METHWTKSDKSIYPQELAQWFLWLTVIDKDVLLIRVSMEHPHHWDKNKGENGGMVIDFDTIYIIISVPSLKKTTIFPVSQFSLLVPQINMEVLEINKRFKVFILEALQSIPKIELPIKKEVTNG